MNTRSIPLEELLAALKAFKNRHAEEYRLYSLGVFGSYARGEATKKSDVDIVFETDDPNLFRTARMKQELEQLLERPVDVIRLRPELNPRMKARIEKEALYV